MLALQGRLKIGEWVPAWFLSRAWLLSSAPTTTQVIPVLAAPWKRSQRTAWVWRHRDTEYPPNCFGGEIPSNMGHVWGEQLFASEVEAWAFAVGWYRTRLRKRQQEMASEVERCAVELGEVSAMLAMARLRDA